MQHGAPRLMPIGRFSEVTGLGIKALRNYDESGLLRPAFVDPETGYRYYSLAQTNRAEAVRLLRAVDVPLREIGEILGAGDRGAVAARLQEHRERLERRLADVQRTLGFLQELIESEDGLMPYEIAVKRAPACTVLAVSARIDTDKIGQECAAAFAEIGGFAAEERLAFAGPPFTLYSEFDEEERSASMQICVPVDREPAAAPHGRLEVVALPAVTLAWTMHRGPYREVRPAYAALYGWIEERGHTTLGFPRETYLNGPDQVAEGDLLTEVAWPIDATAEEAP